MSADLWLHCRLTRRVAPPGGPAVVARRMRCEGARWLRWPRPRSAPWPRSHLFPVIVSAAAWGGKEGASREFGVRASPRRRLRIKTDIYKPAGLGHRERRLPPWTWGLVGSVDRSVAVASFWGCLWLLRGALRLGFLHTREDVHRRLAVSRVLCVPGLGSGPLWSSVPGALDIPEPGSPGWRRPRRPPSILGGPARAGGAGRTGRAATR